METIGSILKEAREKQNKAVDDIVEATKISRANIAAIESENFDFCPEDAYTRAFIKIYAEEVSLDAEALIAMYDETISGKNRADDKVKSVAETDLFLFLYSNKTVVISIICLVVGVLFFAFYEKNDACRTDRELTPGSEVSSVTPPSSTSNINPGNESGLAGQGETVSEFSTQGKDAVAEDAKIEKKTALVGEEGKVVGPPETFAVRFVARDLTWLKIVADDEVSEIMLRAGDSHTQTALTSMKVRIGNSGSVSLFYNDIPLGSPGDPGETVNILFPEAAQDLKTFE